VAYNFQNENNQMKLFTEYERITQNYLFYNALHTALMSGRKYWTIPQNGESSRESNVRTLLFGHLTCMLKLFSILQNDSTGNKTL
jgi:hypothetical protein